MNWIIDSLIICFIILLAIRGYSKGFIEEFGEMVGLYFSGLLSILNISRLAKIINDNLVLEQWISKAIAFVLIFSCSLIIIRIIIKTIHIIFLSENNRWMNKLLGSIVGAVKGVGVVMVLIWFIAVLPLTKWTDVIKNNSRFAKNSNQLRLFIISIFNLNDSVIEAESYLKKITRP